MHVRLLLLVTAVVMAISAMAVEAEGAVIGAFGWRQLLLLVPLRLFPTPEPETLSSSSSSSSSSRLFLKYLHGLLQPVPQRTETMIQPCIEPQLS